MAHHLQLFAEFTQELQGLEETIDLGTKRDAEIEVKDVIEPVGRVPDHRTGIRIPLLPYLAGIHAVVHGQVGRDVEVLQHIERGLNRHGVAHAVAPVLDQTLVQKFVLLGGQRVLEPAIVAHLDLLIPALVAHGALALERCRLGHVDSQVGERDSNRRVGCALRHVGIRREGPLAVGNLVGQVHRAALGILGKGTGVVGVEAVARIACSGKVHAGRESQVRIGFLVLAVAPHHLEVAHFVVIGIAFLACHGREVVDAERARELVAFGIG